MNSIEFSVIVPVYNVKQYLEKCINSILNQTYKDFELILVDDGSNDGSEDICDKYLKKDKRIKVIHKKNGGLSDARNFGIEKASKDYILFIDSDDYIESLLLEKLNETLQQKKVDIVRFGLTVVDENYKIKLKSNEADYINEKPVNLIDQLINTKFLEPACFYCYNLNFLKTNNFKYAKGKLHEDFGLTPLIICKAKSMSWINYNGYNYLQRSNSIINNKNEKVEKQKFKDILSHYDNFINDYKNETIYKKLLCYLTESIIYKGKYLKNGEYEKYKKELNKRKVSKNIYVYNYKKLIKKIIATINIDLYINIFCK